MSLGSLSLSTRAASHSHSAHRSPHTQLSRTLRLPPPHRGGRAPRGSQQKKCCLRSFLINDHKRKTITPRPTTPHLGRWGTRPDRAPPARSQSSQEAGGRYSPAYITSSTSCHHRPLLSPIICCEHKSGRGRVRTVRWVGRGKGRGAGERRGRGGLEGARAPVLTAPPSSVFQCSATSFASGSSGFGALSNACPGGARASCASNAACAAGWAAAHLDAQQYRPDLQGWAPLVLQDIQADASQPVNVRMVNFGEEPNLVEQRLKR